MAGCCDCPGYAWIFDDRYARRRAARYRKRGLDRSARRLVGALDPADVRGATVLEVGGGVGEVSLELLRRGASAATNLELSPNYEAEAARLVDEAGLSGRVHRRLVDIAADPSAVEPADVVVLHRVVCCYPDYAALLGAAADHARRRLVFTHPRRNPATRAFVTTQNTVLRLSGRPFRTFTHPPARMLAVLAEHGLHLTAARAGPVWQVAALSR